MAQPPKRRRSRVSRCRAREGPPCACDAPILCLATVEARWRPRFLTAAAAALGVTPSTSLQSRTSSCAAESACCPCGGAAEKLGHGRLPPPRKTAASSCIQVRYFAYA